MNSKMVFDVLATAGKLPGQPISQGQSDWTMGHIETTLNLMLANGITRIAPGAQPLAHIENPNSTWWRGFFAGPGRTFGIPDGQTIYSKPANDSMWYADMKVDSLGYAYTGSNPTVRYSMIGLFVYSGIASLFIIWTLCRGVTSASWQISSELLALALRSPPPSDSVMPSSILEDSKALRTRYAIMAVGAEIQLLPTDGDIPDENKVKPNRLYK